MGRRMRLRARSQRRSEPSSVARGSFMMSLSILIEAADVADQSLDHGAAGFEYPYIFVRTRPRQFRKIDLIAKPRAWALCHHQYAIAEKSRFKRIVGDEQHGRAEATPDR